MGNLTNYHCIGTQTRWGQCHLVSLDVIGQCFDYPTISGPASCLKHVFWILLVWGCVCLFFWYTYVTPLLEWEDSNTLWGFTVFDPIQLIRLDGLPLNTAKSPISPLHEWETCDPVLSWILLVHSDQVARSGQGFFCGVNWSNRSKQLLF